VPDRPVEGRKWRPVPEPLRDIFESIVSLWPEAEKRQMFGCPCAFVHGQMFAGLHQESMMLRLSDEDRHEFLSTAGARPFEPMPGRPMREYVVVPDAVLQSSHELGVWFGKAFDYAASLPPKEAKARSSSRTKGQARSRAK
jgi:TfoX/Sxy family transcriptional regulator of competence genes